MCVHELSFRETSFSEGKRKRKHMYAYKRAMFGRDFHLITVIVARRPRMKSFGGLSEIITSFAATLRVVMVSRRICLLFQSFLLG